MLQASKPEAGFLDVSTSNICKSRAMPLVLLPVSQRALAQLQSTSSARPTDLSLFVTQKNGGVFLAV